MGENPGREKFTLTLISSFSSNMSALKASGFPIKIWVAVKGTFPIQGWLPPVSKEQL